MANVTVRPGRHKRTADDGPLVIIVVAVVVVSLLVHVESVVARAKSIITTTMDKTILLKPVRLDMSFFFFFCFVRALDLMVCKHC